MLHEYAIEPAALTRFETCRYILEKMGIPEGRYIAKYPTNWFKSVLQACDDDKECLPINRQRIGCLLKNVSSCILSRHDRYYDSDLEWLQNAEYAHSEVPFHAILARENPRGHTSVRSVYDITKDDPLLKISREKIITRTTTELLNVVLPFLELANEFVFVDSFFNPLQQKYRNTTRAFLTAIGKTGKSVKRLEYHTRGDRGKDDLSAFNDFRQACIDNISGCLSHNLNLKIYRWNQRTGGKQFHARYLLTNIGGIRIDSGMDEAIDVHHGKTNQDTDVSLIDQNVYEEMWERFTDPLQYFDRSDNDCVEVY